MAKKEGENTAQSTFFALFAIAVSFFINVVFVLAA
jgi:hypothetical protein